MSDAVVVGRLLPLPSCGGTIKEQSFSCLNTHLVLLSSSGTARFGVGGGQEVPRPWETASGQQRSHSLRFHKECVEKPAAGLVLPRADISISRTPLAVPSSPSLGWVSEHPSPAALWQAEPSWES